MARLDDAVVLSRSQGSEETLEVSGCCNTSRRLRHGEGSPLDANSGGARMSNPEREEEPSPGIEPRGETPTVVRSPGAPMLGPVGVAPENAPPAASHGPLQTPAPGRTLAGRYTVLDLLGQGGMGVVLAAYDARLDRRVALKLLRSWEGRGDPEGEARMVREAQAMARLNHPPCGGGV